MHAAIALRDGQLTLFTDWTRYETVNCKQLLLSSKLKRTFLSALTASISISLALGCTVEQAQLRVQMEALATWPIFGSISKLFPKRMSIAHALPAGKG